MKRKLLPVLLALAITLVILPFSALALEDGVEDALSFSDVNPESTFAEDIAYVVSKGWIDANEDGTFAPDAFATRQTLWMALARIDGENPSGMEAAMEWAKANSFSSGTRATDGLSRQLLITTLYKYAKLKDYSLDGGGSLDVYFDTEMISNYAQEPLAWAAGNGIIRGTMINTLNPASSACRAHLAAFLHRFAEAMGL